jgi:hypothetical protein
MSQNPPESGPCRFPSHLLPTHARVSPDSNNTTGVVPTPGNALVQQHGLKSLPFATGNPVNQPAPMATFGNHFVASHAALKQVPTGYSEECGHQIRMAAQALAKSCIFCWSQGSEYHSHSLPDCPMNSANRSHSLWKKWNSFLKLRAGCCFYCGCPLKVRLCLNFSPSLTNLMEVDVSYSFWSGCLRTRSSQQSKLPLVTHLQTPIIYYIPRCSTYAGTPAK